MKKLMLLGLLLPSIAFAGNYAECLLSGAKGAKTQTALSAAHRECLKKSPAGYGSVVAGSGNQSWSPFKQTPDQCTIKNTADVGFPPAAYVIAKACCCLHGTIQNSCWGSEKRVFLLNADRQATCESHEGGWSK